MAEVVGRGLRSEDHGVDRVVGEPVSGSALVVAAGVRQRAVRGSAEGHDFVAAGLVRCREHSPGATLAAGPVLTARAVMASGLPVVARCRCRRGTRPESCPSNGGNGKTQRCPPHSSAHSSSPPVDVEARRFASRTSDRARGERQTGHLPSYRKETTESAALHPHRCSSLRRGFIDEILKVQQHQEVYSPHPLRGPRSLTGRRYSRSPSTRISVTPPGTPLGGEKFEQVHADTGPAIGPPPCPVGGGRCSGRGSRCSSRLSVTPAALGYRLRDRIRRRAPMASPTATTETNGSSGFPPVAASAPEPGLARAWLGPVPP